MNERKIIVCFLLPPHEQAAIAVGPRMCALHDPSSRFVPALAGSPLFSTRDNVRHIAAPPCQLFDGASVVAFVAAEMLRPTGRWPRTCDRDRLQSIGGENLIVRVGTGDHDGQRNTPTVREHRPLDAQFAAISGIFAGFFPRREAPWSSPRPEIASATQFPCAGRIPADKPSTAGGTRGAASIPGSTDAQCWVSRSSMAAPSIGSRFAKHKQCRPPRLANSRAAVHLWHFAYTSATTVQCVSTASPVSAQTYPTSPSAYKPPCQELKNSVSCPTHGVHACSVLG